MGKNDRRKAGVAKRNRGCNLCKPWRKEGNGGAKEQLAKRDPLILYRAVGHKLHESYWQDDLDRV